VAGIFPSGSSPPSRASHVSHTCLALVRTQQDCEGDGGKEILFRDLLQNPFVAPEERGAAGLKWGPCSKSPDPTADLRAVSFDCSNLVPHWLVEWVCMQ